MSTTDNDFVYSCLSNTNYTCPNTCISVQDCDTCGCVVKDTGDGPSGKAMDVIMCLLPIMFLLAVTLKRDPFPTTKSLPLAALGMFLVRVMYLGSDPLLSCAAVKLGVHAALSPITILAGSTFLYESMEVCNGTVV